MSQIYMQRFGEKLRLLRQQRRLTMQQLADELGFASHGFVGDLEHGRKKPSAELIIRLAEFFEVTTDQLLLDALEVTTENNATS